MNLIIETSIDDVELYRKNEVNFYKLLSEKLQKTTLENVKFQTLDISDGNFKIQFNGSFAEKERLMLQKSLIETLSTIRKEKINYE